MSLRYAKPKRPRGPAGPTYWYFDPPGGPRIPLGKDLGPRALTLAYAAAMATLERDPDPTTMAGLIHAYERSEAYRQLRPATRKGYDYHLAIINERWGSAPIAAIDRNTRSARAEFKKWRRTFADRPRTADYLWAVLKLLFGFAIDEGLLRENPCKGGGRGERFYRSDRRNKIWTEADIVRFEAVASPELRLALRLALDTGLRQGDLLALTWSAFDGERINWQTSKRGRRVSILLSEDVRAMLASARYEDSHIGSTHILTNSRGRPWTSSGFHSSWGKACEKAGIEGLHFHDLRGTAVTRAAFDGATPHQLASRFGWSLKAVLDLLDHHYLADDQRAGDAIVNNVVRMR